MKRHVRCVLMLAVVAMALTGLSLAQQFAYRVAANIPYTSTSETSNFQPGTTFSR